LRAGASGERRSQQQTHDEIACGGQVYHQASSGYVRIWNNTLNKTLRGGAVFPRWAVCLAALLLAWPSPARSTPFRPGAVLIKLRSSSAPAAAQALLPSGAALEAALGRDAYAVQVPVGQEPRYARHLAALPQVAYAQLDHAVAAQQAPDDPRYPEQWGMAHIGMPDAWGIITDTSTLTIAVIDTGIKADHPDLADEIWVNPGEIEGNGLDDDANGYVDDVHGWHFYHTYSAGQALAGQNNDISDGNGHGTHVAGIIAAEGNNSVGVAGVAWRAKIMPIRVLDPYLFGWDSDEIQGLNYAVANGAQVVNMSLGLAQAGPAFAEAVAQAEDRGVLVVAAAGNSGGAVVYPAAYPTVLSVGASDQSDQRAGFSAHGPRLDLLAPGVDILSTWIRLPYFTRSGTSMAAPHVAGAAALLRAYAPHIAPAVARACLLHSASDLGAAGRDNDTGWGLLNVPGALRRCADTIYIPIAHN
jgi:subtilisin family serine protease